MATTAKGPIVERGEFRFKIPQEIYLAFAKSPNIVIDRYGGNGLNKADIALLKDVEFMRTLLKSVEAGKAEVIVRPTTMMG